MAIAENRVALFPNPAKDVVYVDLQNIGSQAHATISDISGRIIDTFTIGGDARLTINVSTYPAGTYILRILSDEINFVEMFVIKR